jgi:hypothetical protein
MADAVLSPKQLALVFGVSEVTVYNWGKETPTKSALPVRRTAAAIEKWATKNGVALLFKPSSDVVKKAGGTPLSRRQAASAKTLRRTATGNMTSVYRGNQKGEAAGRAAAKGHSAKPR